MSRSTVLGPQAAVRLPQGVIRYRETGPRDAPALVFTHAFLVNGDVWRKVVPALSAEYRCITPDWPMGSHELPLHRPADLSLPGLAELLEDFLAALDLRAVTLVGNDTGGAVIQYLVGDHPERVARIVLTSCDFGDNFPPPPFGLVSMAARLPGFGWAAVQMLRVPALRRLPITYGWFAKRPINEAAMRSYIEPGLRNREIRRDIRSWLRSADRAWSRRAARRLPRFGGPALVVWAEEDRLFPPEHGRRLAELLPDARLVTIPDSYACIPEDSPDRLATLIAEFLKDTADTA